MPRRRPLGVNVAANILTAASVLLTALISVPLMLGEIGLAGYGIWTLAQTLILWTTIAEAGFGPAVQRFVAVGQGAGRADGVRRLLWSTLMAYAVFGAVLGTALALLAPVVTDLLDPPAELRDDAQITFQLSAVVLWLALLTAGLGNVQQGLERFAALAISAAAGSVVFLVAVVAVLAAGLGLPGIALAAGLQQLAMLLTRVIDLRGHFGRPGLIRRREARALGGFTLRLQVTTVSTIVNSQTDKVVVGVVASSTTLGQLGIGTQVAEAGRLLAGAALSPLISRLSVTHGSGDDPGFQRLFARLHRLWTLVVIGATVLGLALLYPLVAGWLGAGYGDAAVYGALLVAAYGIGLLVGTPVAYLRALGQPGLEARMGVVLIVLNVALTVTLGVLAGAVGVVAATAVAHAVATTWFLRAFHRAAPDAARLPRQDLLRAVVAALVVAAPAFGWGLAMITLLPAGLALVPVGLGAGVALVAYLALALRVRPTVGAVRALLS